VIELQKRVKVAEEVSWREQETEEAQAQLINFPIYNIYKYNK
jgi:hypothetical protein